MNDINISTYCTNAFGGYDSWNNSICCEVRVFRNTELDEFMSFKDIIKSPIVQNLQKNLLAGVKDPLCKACWKHEEYGISSLREFSTFTGNSFSFNNIRDEIQDQKIRRLVINSGTNCNLSCRSCGPWLSSSWWKETKYRKSLKLYNEFFVPEKLKPTNVEQLLLEDYSKIKNVMILGGEPFLNLDHVKVLHKIIQDGNSKNCELNYTSNFTLPIPEGIKEVAKEFKNTFFTMSIDAVGDQFHYIRTTGIWEDVLQNIKEAQKENFILSINSVISILNIMYLDDLSNFARSFNLLTHEVFLVNADYLTPIIFTPEEKDKIVSHLQLQNIPNVESYIDYIKSYGYKESARKRFWDEIQMTKDYHGLDANHYLPKLMKIFQ